MTYANAGIPVLLKEVEQAALDRGMATIRKNYESTVSKGKMTAEAMAQDAGAHHADDDATTASTTVDIVVEAVFENMDLKKSTFAELGTRDAARAASSRRTRRRSTSTRSRAPSGRPAQVIGHHFFSPANVMKLLEIVRGRETSTEAIATSLKLAKRLGKVGVVVGNCFGFVANRMLAYYMREAYLLLEEGASVPQIDKALTDFGMPVGPFGMQDIAGIDVGRAHPPVPEIDRQDPRRGSAVGGSGSAVTRWAATARRPAPAGIDTKPAAARAFPIRSIDEIAAEEARKRGITRRAIAGRGDHRAHHDGAGQRGRARARGGLRHPRQRHRRRSTATASAFRAIAAVRCSTPTRSACRPCSRECKEYRARFGDYWRPAPLLEQLVAEGRGFYSRALHDGRRPRTTARAGRPRDRRQRLAGRHAGSHRRIRRGDGAIVSGSTSMGARAHRDAFGTTIAHGFLTLSLLSVLLRGRCRRRPADGDQLRTQPRAIRVAGASGSRIRARIALGKLERHARQHASDVDRHGRARRRRQARHRCGVDRSLLRAALKGCATTSCTSHRTQPLSTPDRSEPARSSIGRDSNRGCARRCPGQRSAGSIFASACRSRSFQAATPT